MNTVTLKLLYSAYSHYVTWSKYGGRGGDSVDSTKKNYIKRIIRIMASIKGEHLVGEIISCTRQ
jgi:hypothetical protein